MTTGMLGRKVGMTRLYDGAGRVRVVTVIECGPNPVTQVRTPERDGYSAVQVGFPGKSKRVNRPERGHLRKANVEQPLTLLREFRTDDAYTLGQVLNVGQFEAGQYVNVLGTSKGRGFAGGVRRWHFAGGPKTHGQSDRHRAPGSVGAGTTPGRTFRGQKMAGHMGARTATVLNLLVVAVDPVRNLLFVEGSVPGPTQALVTVLPGRKPALAKYTPPTPFWAAAAPETEAVAVDAPDEAPSDAPAADDGASDAASADAPPVDGGDA